MTAITRLLLAATAAALGAALWWRRHPSACPYDQRALLFFPRPGITVAKLRARLDPQPGERILEVGPGTGHYTLDVAAALGPGGRLDAFDLQPEMLELVSRRAAERGLGNIVTRQGDARALPYEDASFDGAFLVTVLGEVPDQDAALRELRRVLKPGGRLLLGEIALDPHFVSARSLGRRAPRAGLRFVARHGGPLAFLARLERSD
ncbi:MAG: methyltransferase domain-containing protein [Actinomycetota bacterium]|nr:methyltransferase domain-containing protein [Actinomycetota bacterium]